VAAIEDRCSRRPIRATLHTTASARTRRLPRELEAAAYFLVTEALANVLKHSGSPSVEIGLDAADGVLGVEVADAGCGSDPRPAAEGSGIAGLTDRIRALGGVLEVHSGPGAATRLAARLPLPSVSGGTR